jgi:hypothetical protein
MPPGKNKTRFLQRISSLKLPVRYAFNFQYEGDSFIDYASTYFTKGGSCATERRARAVTCRGVLYQKMKERESKMRGGATGRRGNEEQGLGRRASRWVGS